MTFSKRPQVIEECVPYVLDILIWVASWKRAKEEGTPSRPLCNLKNIDEGSMHSLCGDVIIPALQQYSFFCYKMLNTHAQSLWYVHIRALPLPSCCVLCEEGHLCNCL